MSNLKLAALDSFEELDDADLATVRGGTDILGSAVGAVTDTNSALGNGGKPTSGLLNLVGVTLVNTGIYVIGVSNVAESGLQALNGGVAKVGNGL